MKARMKDHSSRPMFSESKQGPRRPPRHRLSTPGPISLEIDATSGTAWEDFSRHKSTVVKYRKSVVDLRRPKNKSRSSTVKPENPLTFGNSRSATSTPVHRIGKKQPSAHWKKLRNVISASNMFDRAGKHRRRGEEKKRERILAEKVSTSLSCFHLKVYPGLQRTPLERAVGGQAAVGCIGCGGNSAKESMRSHDYPTEIFSHIIVGGKNTAADRHRLYMLGVTHILNVAKQVKCYNEYDFLYLHVPLIDQESEVIRPHFEQCFTFLDDAKEAGTKCFVHCIAGKAGCCGCGKLHDLFPVPQLGVSRSITVVVAYLMAREGMRLNEAILHVLKRRRYAKPNTAFLLALAKYEIELYGNSSVADSPLAMWNFWEWNKEKGKVKKYPRTRSQTSCVVC